MRNDKERSADFREELTDGNQVTTQSSGDNRGSEAQEKHSPNFDSLSPQRGSVEQQQREKTRTLADYRPQHDNDCAQVSEVVDGHATVFFQNVDCSCGLDALLAALAAESEGTATTDSRRAQLWDAILDFACVDFTTARDWERVNRAIDALLKADEKPPVLALRVCPDAIGSRVVQRVAELPDRTSPEEWPEAMLVTSAELQFIVTDEINDAAKESR